MQLGEIYKHEKEKHDVAFVILEHARLKMFYAYSTMVRLLEYLFFAIYFLSVVL